MQTNAQGISLNSDLLSHMDEATAPTASQGTGLFVPITSIFDDRKKLTTTGGRGLALSNQQISDDRRGQGRPTVSNSVDTNGQPSPGWYSPLRSTGEFKVQGSQLGSKIDFKTHMENLQLEEMAKQNLRGKQRPTR